MADVRITGLQKHYGGFHALKGIDLAIKHGEFVVFVGPSGCGKSTLLRTIAGLEDVSGGEIAIGGKVVNKMRPRDRDISMVFQNYALYPYLSVYDNVAFGLRARKMAEAEIHKRVENAAETLGIGPLLKRFPRELSGGQRQRVAIGRAIVRQAQLFLFDEPLSNLDAKLRDEMRAEIKRLHRDIATTMIYVTHDQVEAMTLADRIVILRDGRIEQQGAPLDLFERPATGFVAGFLGSPSINLIPAKLVSRGGSAALQLRTGETLELPASRTFPGGERDIVLGIRPQHLTRAVEGDPSLGIARIAATADLIQPTGTRTFVTSRIGGVAVTAELSAHDVNEQGGSLTYTVDLNRAILIDPLTDRVL
ncbi:MAG: sn-glycerol-3-phosphate ABC transporter ATP-binding protein UgpC [Candidatus Saccharibacteria bacterium]|nr:sn-glycerol-3-phosphate ABC transporter ATP-binding protein UgpC [Pseudorhodobacter sp.]